MVLKKENTVFERDEKGELIPQEVELYIDENDAQQLKYKGETIFITPLTRGEIKKRFSNVDDDSVDLDADLIVERCKNPKYTKEDVNDLNTVISQIIVNTILIHSGIDVLKSSNIGGVKKESEYSKN